MKRFIFLCLASIFLLSSCDQDYAPSVYDPLTYERLNVTVNGVTAIINQNTTHPYSNGICWDTIPMPSLQNSFHKEWKDNIFFLDNLQENTTYYLRTYISNLGCIVYGKEITFTTESEYVDLGLSVKWGTINVGTSIKYPYGQYFAWGETDSKSSYTQATYKWGIGNSDQKYCKYLTDSKYASSAVDNKAVLDLGDDAAYILSKHKAQIPTKEQWEELISACNWKWVTQNDGQSGYKVMSKINNKSIFLPLMGDMYGNTIDNMGESLYWSKSLYTKDNRSAWCFHGSHVVYMSSMRHEYTLEMSWTNRLCGLPIRPVCPK